MDVPAASAVAASEGPACAPCLQGGVNLPVGRERWRASVRLSPGSSEGTLSSVDGGEPLLTLEAC
jgi:hypothetical protein